MFRESDFQPTALHSTFSTKPIPTFQLQSQIARFNEKSVASLSSCSSTTLDPLPSAVPSSNDFFYDPSHPDADWSGMVSLKRNQRKHERSHASQRTNIIQTEAGIVSLGNKNEYVKTRRSDLSDPNDVIGGIGTNDHWKTTYMSLAVGEGTNISQLTLQKRSLPRKAIPDPAQSQSSSSTVLHTYFEDDQYYMTSARSQDSRSAPTSLAGYRAPANVSRSLIANLGASLVGKISDPISQPVSREISKTLLTQNYNPAPGKRLALTPCSVKWHNRILFF